jgi:hypothetical protein
MASLFAQQNEAQYRVDYRDDFESLLRSRSKRLYRQPPSACRNHGADVKNDEYRFSNDVLHGHPPTIRT